MGGKKKEVMKTKGFESEVIECLNSLRNSSSSSIKEKDSTGGCVVWRNLTSKEEDSKGSCLVWNHPIDLCALPTCGLQLPPLPPPPSPQYIGGRRKTPWWWSFDEDEAAPAPSPPPQRDFMEYSLQQSHPSSKK